MQYLARALPRAARAAALVLLLVSSACARDDQTAPDAEVEEAPVQVTVVTLGLILDRITAEVTAPDISTPLIFNLPLANGVASGTLRLPPGENRTITLRAFDDVGLVTHEGSRTINVRPGMNMPAVQITLRARAGQVPITGTLGTIALQVASIDGNAFIGEGQAEQYTVQVVDLVSGNPLAVTPGDIQWAISNPAFASVSTTGVVTGVRAGSGAFVVATFEGTAGVAPLQVLAPNTGVVILSVNSLQLGGPIAASVELVDGSGASTFGGTDGSGFLQFSPLPSGAGSVIVSNVPAGCTQPPPQPIVIPDGGSTSVEVLVSCAP